VIPRDQRGQAVTETILLSWIMIVFFAAAYQLYLSSNTIYQSLAAVHQEIFRQGFAHNCITHTPQCTYRTSPTRHALVVWDAATIPERQTPVLNLFARFGLPSTLFVSSHLSRGPGCTNCKKTQMGAGPAGPGTGPGAILRLFQKSLAALREVGRRDFLPAFRDRFTG
jgi:hypothetical protein